MIASVVVHLSFIIEEWEKKGRWGCYWFISYRPRAGAGKLEEASWFLPKVAGERL